MVKIRDFDREEKEKIATYQTLVGLVVERWDEEKLEIGENRGNIFIYGDNDHVPERAKIVINPSYFIINIQDKSYVEEAIDFAKKSESVLEGIEFIVNLPRRKTS